MLRLSAATGVLTGSTTGGIGVDVAFSLAADEVLRSGVGGTAEVRPRWVIFQPATLMRSTMQMPASAVMMRRSGSCVAGLDDGAAIGVAAADAATGAVAGGAGA